MNEVHGLWRFLGRMRVFHQNSATSAPLLLCDDCPCGLAPEFSADEQGALRFRVESVSFHLTTNDTNFHECGATDAPCFGRD